MRVSVTVNRGEVGIWCERIRVMIRKGLGNHSKMRPSVNQYKWMRGIVSEQGNKR